MHLYDPRIRPLMFAIRHWAKTKELAGNQNSGPRLTGYALTMMVFFYLQQVEPPVLLSVENMAQLAGMKYSQDNGSDKGTIIMRPPPNL